MFKAGGLAVLFILLSRKGDHYEREKQGAKRSKEAQKE
jgi:hypothetical protein